MSLSRDGAMAGPEGAGMAAAVFPAGARGVAALGSRSDGSVPQPPTKTEVKIMENN